MKFKSSLEKNKVIEESALNHTSSQHITTKATKKSDGFLPCQGAKANAKQAKLKASRPGSSPSSPPSKDEQKDSTRPQEGMDLKDLDFPPGFTLKIPRIAAQNGC